MMSIFHFGSKAKGNGPARKRPLIPMLALCFPLASLWIIAGAGNAGSSSAPHRFQLAEMEVYGLDTDPPLIKDFGLNDYVRLSKDLPHSEEKTWRLVCGMPYNCQF